MERYLKKRMKHLAIAMNRIKGASCSGEGGEDKNRFKSFRKW